MSKPSVFLALPTYDWTFTVGTAKAAFVYPTRNRCNIAVGESLNSLLAHGFNGLWYEALNKRLPKGITHFAMLHADVIPQAHWLDVLMDELPPGGLVSAVVPIKSPKGLTSTAIAVEDDEFAMPKRLTLREVHALPPTFTAADTEYPDRPLLVNTGCWLADIRQPWAEQVFFTIRDKIVRDDRGKFHALASPEDWHFSRMLFDLGVPVAATRKVKIEHRGSFLFGNDTPWGDATDTVFEKQEAMIRDMLAGRNGEAVSHAAVS